MMDTGVLIDKLTKKQWQPIEITEMVGDSRSAYLSYALDEEVRGQAASGGTTSMFLIYALENKLIDGAIVCRTAIEEGKVRAHMVLAKTRDEVLAARGSKYVETRFLKEVLPLLREAEGRYAVCGLPCDITNLRRWEEKEPSLKDKIAFRITFLCGHNSRKELIDGITQKLNETVGEEKQLEDFKFRTGSWRGEMSATYDDGTVLQKKFSYFSDYRNLHFYSERKCMACTDHFGYQADISFGDVWLYSLKKAKVKHTGVLIRDKFAEEVFNAAVNGGVIHADEVSAEYILDGQSRVAPTHYNVSARAKAGEKLDVKILDTQQTKVSFFKFVTAYLGLLNMRYSEGPNADKIFEVPRWMIRFYLYFKKGLETLK